MKKESGCYNCPVENCDANYRGSRCAALRHLKGIDTDPKTNADDIRSMTDEELADQLVIDVDGLEKCRLYLSVPTGKMFISRPKAVEFTLKWLRQQVEK